MGGQAGVAAKDACRKIIYLKEEKKKSRVRYADKIFMAIGICDRIRFYFSR